MMQMTVISGSERRRRWSDAEREEIVVASFSPGAVIAEVARQFDVSTRNGAEPSSLPRGVKLLLPWQFEFTAWNFILMAMSEDRIP